MGWITARGAALRNEVNARHDAVVGYLTSSALGDGAGDGFTMGDRVGPNPRLSKHLTKVGFGGGTGNRHRGLFKSMMLLNL